MPLSFPANSQDSKDQKQRADAQSRYGVGGADDLPKEVLQRDLDKGQLFLYYCFVCSDWSNNLFMFKINFLSK